MHFTTQTIALVASLLSVAAAAPTQATSPNVARAFIVLPGTTDQGQTTSARSAPVEKRGATDKFGDYSGSTSQYPDGSGTYLRTDDEHRYGGGDKCWTDMFYVTSSYNPKTTFVREGSIECGTTSECEMGVDDGVQTCTNWSVAVTVGFEAGIPDIATASGSVTTSFGGDKCDQATTKSTCKWDDGGCHAVWSSQSVKTNHGYIRRRCDFHDGKGDVTVWSKDWDVTEKATALHLGCKASCTDVSYTA